MKRTSVLASTAALTLLSVMLVQACSGEEGGEDQGQGNLMGQGGALGAVGGSGPAGVGGTGAGAAGAPAAVGGTGTEAQGGATNVAGQGGTATSPATGGAAGTPAAGAGGAPPAQGGTGGAPPTGAPPACAEDPAPSNGVSCTVTCTDPCSIHQLGSRVCDCPGEEVCDPGQTAPCYDCGTCVPINPNDPLFAVPAGPLPDCTADDTVLENMAGCTENDRCLSLRLNGDMERSRFCGCRAGSWDCDSKPSNFP